MFDDRYGEADVVVPQPLDIKAQLGDAADYPLDALPPPLRKAIEAIVAIAQVPVSLAAQSVMGAASLAAQGHINVETITGQGCPVSLFLFTIAASGDRKSTSDRFAILPVKEREEYLAQWYASAQNTYTVDDAAYKASIQKAKTGSKGREEIRTAMEAVGAPPRPPMQPLLTADEPTGPGLQRLFAEAMPALGLFSDEGATFLGGWSMQEEQQASTGGMLSKLWDGSPIKRIRADKENGTQILYGRRLCLHLMVQPDIAGKLLGNQAVRNQGLLSRILVAAPRSLKGSRFWKEPSEEDRENLRQYHARLGRLLEFEFRYRDETSRALDLDLVRLTADARARLIAFSDHCERQLGPGGKYEQIADFASKMTENATRLAAVVAYFAAGQGLKRDGLSLTAVNAGIALVEFYAGEAARLYGAAAVDDDTHNAALLIDWIRKKGHTAVGVRYLNRRGPTQVRAATALKRAIEVLVEHQHLVKIKGPAVLDLEGEPKSYAEAYTVVEVDAA
ncbi:YfjI family protein [Sphingomonas sp. BK069]|uniref:YfjI family protein n=1 Tax=Sphingomonas sp. BK069 TaxID=2586979 RepID=UPI0021A91B70|nr:YfjI family protein [Sphingomonas sp. BK069]